MKYSNRSPMEMPIRGITWTAFVVLALVVGCRPGNPYVSWRGGSLSRVDYESWLRFTEIVDRPAAAREMVLVRHLAQAARERGVDQEPLPKIELKELRQKVLAAKLRQHVISNVHIDPDEVAGLHEQRPRAFHKPRKLQLRNIYLRLNGDAGERETVRARLEKMRADLLAGEDFEAMARRESRYRVLKTNSQESALSNNAFSECVYAVVIG